jgi:L-amino acid N-acyltransferase YncA
MENKLTMRLIKNDDSKGALDVYKPYVVSTAITFEYDVPSLDDFSTRVETIANEYPWLVCLKDDKIIGYAYASKHRYKTAYQWSPESTIYLSSDYHRKGIAKILYKTLFSILRLQGYVNVYAGVALPNIKSEEFHIALGFNKIGDFSKIGFKLGKWHDVRWFQLHLTEHIDNPQIPKSIKEIEKTSVFQTILANANAELEDILIKT